MPLLQHLVSLTWLPANGGLVNPASAVGALTRAAGVPFVLDAAQAVGQMSADVRTLACDVLTAPGRKWLRGPRGTGLLYVRRGFLAQLQPRTVDHFTAPWTGSEYTLRNDARRFEVGEASVALRLGLVGFTVDAMDAAQVQRCLANAGVAVAVSGMAFTPLDMRARGLHDIVRASPHVYTTQESVDHLLRTLQQSVRAA